MKWIIISAITISAVGGGAYYVATSQQNSEPISEPTVEGSAVESAEDEISVIENIIIETAQELEWPEVQFHHVGRFYDYGSSHKERCRYYTGNEREETFATAQTFGYWPASKEDSPCRYGYAVKESVETGISDFDAVRERCYQLAPDSDKYSCSKGPYMYHADYTMFRVGDYNFYARIEKQGGSPGTSEVSQNSEDIAMPLIRNIKEHYKDGKWYK